MQDFVSGNTEGAPGPEWTAAHVDRFQEAGLESIKSAWRAALDKAGPVLRRMGEGLLPDIVTHEFDVRGTLGNTDERESNRLAASLDVLAGWGDAHYRSDGIPALRIRTDRKHYVLGDGSPEVSVTGTVFEVSRVTTGRRSRAQILALDWSG